jgi:hypothetical protein
MLLRFGWVDGVALWLCGWDGSAKEAPSYAAVVWVWLINQFF